LTRATEESTEVLSVEETVKKGKENNDHVETSAEEEGDIHYIGRFQLFWHKCTKLSQYKSWIQFNYFEFSDSIYML
jgi:hypothetical protein